MSVEYANQNYVLIYAPDLNDILQLDATLSQDHSYKNKATSFPVEQGLDITDHIRQEPDELKIEGIITNDPEDSTGFVTKNYAEAAYEFLCKIAGRRVSKSQDDKGAYKKPILVTVLGTRHRVYTDMIMEDLSFSFTNTTGDAIQFTASFKNIRKASTSIATVNFTSTRLVGDSGKQKASPKVDSGTQPVAAPTVDQKGLVETAGSIFDTLAEKVSQLVGGL